ncbi:diguanylate cyclase [Rhodoferax sp. OV413]|uniref:GGDEF domain-containing protein n=1 Tax=Rhodoferax sp. OV413 TaxID=1855285 RepID=UPI00088B390E|nr:GGDEF domain-containing protein [Rhodoferax sp. OV413]SDP82152.1 diguanylate cyclase [Rhodoferax sp. OV413]
MLGIDPRSIVLLAGAMGLLMSLVLFVLRRNYPPTIQGLGEWAAGPFLCFISTLLFGARGLIPDFVSAVIGNLFLLSGSALFYIGSQRFHRQPTSLRLWGGLIVASAPVFAWFVLVQPNYVARLVVFTSLMVCLFFSHARLLFKHGADHIFTQLTGGVLLLQTGFLLLRLVTIPIDPHTQGIFDESPFQVIYVVAYAMCVLLLSIGVVLMASERMRSEFEYLATHDPLTACLTRRALIAACEQELERSRRHGHPLALMMLDLDHFKNINDTHGHLVGDRVLVDFADRVGQQLRLPDRLGRFGGEEFVVLLPETRLDNALHVAERIRHSLGQSTGLPVCTASIGITTPHSDTDTVDHLLARADQALYRAKHLGRDRVESS